MMNFFRRVPFSFFKTISVLPFKPFSVGAISINALPPISSDIYSGVRYSNPSIFKPAKQLKELILPDSHIKIKELSELLEVTEEKLIGSLKYMSLPCNSEENLHLRQAALVALEYNYRILHNEGEMKERPPVVTIVGHVIKNKIKIV